MNSVERITEIKVVAVFCSTFVSPVVVRHKVRTIIDIVLYGDVPFSHFHVNMQSSRVYIMSYMLSVVLESLKISKA